jgi:hypothetical protein
MPEMTQNEVEDLILSWGDWDAWGNNTGYGLGSRPSHVKLVEWYLDEGDETHERYYDSPHEQGHEGTCFVVFEVDGRYWRKTGTTDSYANRNWNGKFREVQKGEVIITKYEWKEN